MSTRQLDEEAIFHIARRIEAADLRADYLEQACAGDANLRGRVEALLQIHDQEQAFLKSAPVPGPTQDWPAISEGPGQQIGRYKLLQEIGEGGMGTVFMAEQLRPVKRRVALKIIKQGLDTRQFIARFEAERQALALMDHPNIARVLDAGCTDTGRPYFVMELVKGIPITRFCDENRLTARQRLELFVSVCHAVQHAHQKGIIHRDLKPSNVLVALYDDRPVPKIIDFGVAKATNQQLTEKTLFTQVGQIVGTWEYMSPEQAVLNQLDVDTRTDIYSLGVILYELLTGVTPLAGDRLRSAALDEMLRLIREEEPPKPSTRITSLGESATATAAHRGTNATSLAKTLRGDLDWIVMKALDKDRSRRYETANDFAADLFRHLDGEPVEARPPSTAYRLRKAARRYRTAAMMTAVVAIALLGATGTSTWFAVRSKVDRDAAIAAQASERKNVEELHGELIETCLAAVMSGNREQADAAIKKAASAGLSATWLSMLHGLLALSEGRGEEAIRCLEPAAKESVAAKGMLVMAFIYSGRIDEISAMFADVTQHSPVTPEDDLFWAQVIKYSDAKEAEGTIRRAIQKRNSPLAHMFLADAFSAPRPWTPVTEERFGKPCGKARAARCFMGNAPIMLSTYLFVQHVAITLGELRISDELLTEARGFADKLQHFPAGRLELVWFLADFGDEESVERLAAGLTRVSGYEACTYTACQLNRHSPEEVLHDLDRRFERSDLYTRMNWAGVAVLTPARHGEARQLCEQVVRESAGYDLRIACLQTLCLLGHSDRARTLARDSLGTPVDNSRYHRDVMQYIAGETETGAFIEGAGASRVKRSAALFGVAMSELAEAIVMRRTRSSGSAWTWACLWAATSGPSQEPTWRQFVRGFRPSIRDPNQRGGGVDGYYACLPDDVLTKTPQSAVRAQCSRPHDLYLCVTGPHRK